MTRNEIIRHAVKSRKIIVLITFLTFFFVFGLSYYFNGRSYKSGIEFYIVGASFIESNENNSTILPTKQELEIIKSITNSSQLYLHVVNTFNLVKYYHTESFQSSSISEAEDKLRNSTVIKIDDYGKISLFITDLDKYQAFNIANAMMNKINEQYNSYLKDFKKLQTEKCENQIKFYDSEKKKMYSEVSKYPLSVSSLEFLPDSLSNKNSIKKMNQFSDKSGLKPVEVLNVLSIFHRIELVEEQIYKYSEQKQRLQNSLFFIKKSILITNKYINYKHSVNISHHFILAFKIAFVTMGSLIVLISFWKGYKDDILLLIAPKS